MATKYAKLPRSWSNKGKVERLRVDAYESLTRTLNRAVAETGVNFQIWSALRTKKDQVALFRANYRDTGRRYKASSSDRWYGGTTWERRPGSVAVASPDLGSNHQTGVAVDIHPSAIQEWLKRNGGRFGWDWAEGKRNGEDWHFRYYPSRDQYKAEGLLDHAAVQRVVGAEVDGKIGTGTVALIRKWQTAHGLGADGKVGPATKRAMGLSGVGEPLEPVADPPSTAPAAADAGLAIEVPGDSPNANRERFGQAVKTVTFHWWGKPSGQTHDGTVNYLLKDRGDSGTSAHYVVSPGRVSRCVPEEWTAWANGNREINRSDISVECDPNDPLGTLPTAAALLADIWTRHPDAAVHVHSDWVATLCPGEYEDLMDQLVDMAKGQTVDLPVAAPPAGAGLPSGKDLLMALIDAPDFPLLRTSSHRCYFGPRSGPKESVSGHVQNSLNPGAVTRSGAAGLKAWQQRMNVRGYSLTDDGKYGPQTAAAAANLQRLAGLERDEKIGPDTWYAAWLLPVVS